ncbi:ribosome maturation factor RimP [Jatrophihabitans endophyticus]|uniref:ribosome maturation factor RimP n=1 Tax=Jatrophihabitans endophyticus TaxID=1206085 RepID=UPI0019DF978D|nr:ribosome maturation factor RimP [Jatrophihabitans endophyticus]MBE7187781.1 ribosome maturation factor RimP [Jatrophihabitans endophyticus]
MPPATTGDRLEQVLRPLVADAGYDLEEVSVTAAGRRSVVRVVVDADGGIDLDAVADVSRVVSSALDEQAQTGVLAGAYVLEVSSPGTDRPLREPRHWRRAQGRLVTVPVDGTPVTGRVQRTDDSGVTLETDGAERTVGWDALGPGRVQVEFNRASDEGSGEQSW